MIRPFPFVAQPGDAVAAADLRQTFGVRAGLEAAARADRAWELGNHVHYCRWRQVERLVAWFDTEPEPDTIH